MPSHGGRGKKKSIKHSLATESLEVPDGLPPELSSFRKKKRFGQHFLTDASMLLFEAERLECAGKSVLEIGAGDGRLTEKIMAQLPSSISLVELDSELASYLRKKFRKEKSVLISESDVMDFLDGDFPDGFFDCVAGNVPYKVSGPLFARLAKLDFARGIFCVQKEVADRLCARPGGGDWGKLSIFVQRKYAVRRLLSVPPVAFAPPPKVDSTIIELVKKPAAEIVEFPEGFEKVVSALFTHRLQSVSNSLFHSRHEFGLSKDEARKAANTIIYSNSKVFMLSEAQFAQIARQLSGIGK